LCERFARDVHLHITDEGITKSISAYSINSHIRPLEIGVTSFSSLIISYCRTE
jgi:hypothetical protein